MAEIIWVCSICGSLDIEERQWVNINTNEIISSTEEGQWFCGKCEKIVVQIMDQEDFNKQKK